MSSSSRPEYLISGYLDHQLSPEEHAEFEALLRDSAEVRDLLSSLEAQSQQLKALPEYRLPKDFSAQLLARPQFEQAFDDRRNQRVAARPAIYQAGASRFGAAATAIATLAALVLVTLFLPEVAKHSDPSREVSQLEEDQLDENQLGENSFNDETPVDEDRRLDEMEDKGLEHDSLVASKEAVAGREKSRGRVSRSKLAAGRDALGDAPLESERQPATEALTDQFKGMRKSAAPPEDKVEDFARQQLRSNFKVTEEANPVAGKAIADRRSPAVTLDAKSGAKQEEGQSNSDSSLDAQGQQQMWLPPIANQPATRFKGSTGVRGVPQIATATTEKAPAQTMGGLNLAMTPSNEVEGLLDIRLPEGQNSLGFFNEVLDRNEIELGRSANAAGTLKAFAQNAEPTKNAGLGAGGGGGGRGGGDKAVVPVQQGLTTATIQSPQAFLVTATPKQMVGLMLDLKDNDAAVLGYRLTAAGDQIQEPKILALQQAVEKNGEDSDRESRGGLAVLDDSERNVDRPDQKDIKQRMEDQAAANRSFQRSVMGNKALGRTRAPEGQASNRGLALPLPNGIQLGLDSKPKSANAGMGGRAAVSDSIEGAIGSQWKNVPASKRDAEVLNSYFGATDQTKRRYLLFVRSGNPAVAPSVKPSVAAPQSADPLPAKK